MSQWLSCFGFLGRDRRKPNVRIRESLVTLLALQGRSLSVVGAREGAASVTTGTAPKETLQLQRDLNTNYAELTLGLDAYIKLALDAKSGINPVYQSYLRSIPPEEQRKVILEAFLQNQAPDFFAKMGTNPDIAEFTVNDPATSSSFGSLAKVISLAAILNVKPHENTLTKDIFDLITRALNNINSSPEQLKSRISDEALNSLVKLIDYDFFKRIQEVGSPRSADDYGLPASLHNEFFASICLFTTEHESVTISNIRALTPQAGQDFEAKQQLIQEKNMLNDLYRSLLSPNFVEGLINARMDPRLKNQMWEMFGRALEHPLIIKDLKSIDNKSISTGLQWSAKDLTSGVILAGIQAIARMENLPTNIQAKVDALLVKVSGPSNRTDGLTIV